MLADIVYTGKENTDVWIGEYILCEWDYNDWFGRVFDNASAPVNMALLIVQCAYPF